MGRADLTAEVARARVGRFTARALAAAAEALGG